MLINSKEPSPIKQPSKAQSIQVEEHKQQAKVRSSVKPIIGPQNTVNPFSIFKIFQSGIIEKPENIIFPAFSSTNYFKSVMEVLYDKKNKLVKAHLENDPALDSLPWEDLVDKLENNGDTYNLEFAKLLESYLGSVEELKKISKELAQKDGESSFGGMTKDEYQKLRLNLQKTAPCLYIKCTFSENDPTTYEFNDKLITQLGYNPSDFASSILHYGLPEVYPNPTRKYAETLKLLLGKLATGHTDGCPYDEVCELLHADFSTTFAREKIYMYRSFNNKNEMQVELTIYYEHLLNPPPGRKKTVITEFTSTVSLKRQLPPVPTNIDKEREDFLARYYNIKKQDPKDLARTCKIRFLE